MEISWNGKCKKPNIIPTTSVLSIVLWIIPFNLLWIKPLKIISSINDVNINWYTILYRVKFIIEYLFIYILVIMKGTANTIPNNICFFMFSKNIPILDNEWLLFFNINNIGMISNIRIGSCIIILYRFLFLKKLLR